MDEIYILQSCNEWQEHSSARIEVVSTDINMIYAVIYEKLLNGDMLYNFDNTEDSIVAFKEDLANEEFNSDLLTYGMIQSFDNMLLTNPLSLVGHPVIDDIYSELFDMHIETELTANEVMKILDLENTCYLISNVEMEGDEHHFHGFVPLKDDFDEFKETAMYKAFLDLEHTGEIHITSNQIAIGNSGDDEQVIPTEEQAIMLFMHHEEIEKKYPFEPIDGWSNEAYMQMYSDDEFDDEFDR